MDFLENKLIEKGAGPNWLFNIDTLTNLMNYVPMIVAGTSSTNISGTKDVASQAVKKGVSSLRYITLPNWFHEAHMETSTDTLRNSVAQDDSQKEQDCNADVLENSRIFNPTASSKVPSADQVEPAISLTVEFNILTVGSPVPTVCLDISPDSLSGIDYEEVFAPVARIEAIRLFLAYASFMGFLVYQMDVKSAFLYGTIDEEVYVMQPPGFQDLEFPDRVYKVEKAMGTIDQTLFIQKHKGEFLLVQVYVDDIIFGASNPQLCREFEALMHDKFQMSAMGELTFFFGLQLLQKKDDIFLSQDKYVGDIVKKFGYSDVRSANTPIDKENPWGKDKPGKDVKLHLYRSMIGSLMYLTASRPDIMFAVCTCARHQVIPKKCHLYAVKRIFRYLKGHPKLGQWYPKESPFDLVAYSDSNYGGATQDRKSTTRAASGCGQVLWIQNQMLDYGVGLLMIIEVKEHHSPQHDSPPPSHQPLPQAPTETLTHRKYTRRAIQIAQSKALSPAVDEPASLLRDDRQGEAFLTVSSLDAGQDRENIAKISALPHESSPRVPSLDADEGSMQQRIHELIELCTSLKSNNLRWLPKSKIKTLKYLD
nr:hypothetical protein [Tanacetum cinerariifolium]